mmetsp:Transcript_18422/g.31172  ORF Transcript_18422/g.31172 Transcript_18422/m.31172 type:complete len:158 (-) Transcript_18422:435-908(-)
MMFLPESKWSPRYETQFYTIRMNTYTILDKPSPSSDGTTTTFRTDECSLCNHNTKFPAVYYKIEVLRGNTQHTCLRRYSQFLYLSNKICHVTTERDTMHKRHLPPKTGPFHRDSPEFLEERMEGLYQFLMDVLLRPECVNNTWVEAFLELGASDENL